MSIGGGGGVTDLIELLANWGRARKHCAGRLAAVFRRTSIFPAIRATAGTWNRKADQSGTDGHADDGFLSRIGKGGRPPPTNQQRRTDGQYEPTNGACHRR